MRRTMTVAMALVTLGAATPAGADPPPIHAQGNIVTGGLAFAPASVTAKVGDVVSWTNTDFLVPHTATEDHGLWDLTGGYGATPITPPGFGPGQTVKRVIEAGTATYYCKVHPTQMHGTVAVPVTLQLQTRRLRRGHRTRTVQDVVATWAAAPPAPGQVFDVQVRRDAGPWVTYAEGTTATSGAVRAARAGTVTTVRARLRSATDPQRAEGWSPDASVTSTQPASR